MVTESIHDGKTVFICDICGLGYEEPNTAKGCEDYCKTYNSCSIKITSKAIYFPENPIIKESE